MNRFLQTDSKWIHFCEGLVVVGDGINQLDLQDSEHLDFLDHIDELLVEIHHNLVAVALREDTEDSHLSDLKGLQISVDFFVPVDKNWISRKTLQQSITTILELPTFWVLSPIPWKDLAYLVHVFLQTFSDLLGPDHSTCGLRAVSDFANFGVLGLNVRPEELFVEIGNIILDSFEELALVFLNSTHDPWAEEQLVELSEDSEHFVGTGGSTQLLSKLLRDEGLGLINLEIELFFSSCNNLITLLTEIENVESSEGIVPLFDISSTQEPFL